MFYAGGISPSALTLLCVLYNLSSSTWTYHCVQYVQHLSSCIVKYCNSMVAGGSSFTVVVMNDFSMNMTGTMECEIKNTFCVLWGCVLMWQRVIGSGLRYRCGRVHGKCSVDQGGGGEGWSERIPHPFRHRSVLGRISPCCSRCPSEW